jgi:hypothetical protein
VLHCAVLCCAVLCPGPLLRLQGVDEVLTKAQRYGQPYERYIHSSSIPPLKMQVGGQPWVGAKAKANMHYMFNDGNICGGGDVRGRPACSPKRACMPILATNKQMVPNLDSCMCYTGCHTVALVCRPYLCSWERFGALLGALHQTPCCSLVCRPSCRASWALGCRA